ncbi:hypothetical protein [Tessaracoccus sp.]
MPTTNYGSWFRVMGSISAYEEVLNYANQYPGDFNLTAIDRAYQDAVNALLPGSLFLTGEEFLGQAGDDAIPSDWAETLPDLITDTIDQDMVDGWFRAHQLTRITYLVRYADADGYADVDPMWRGGWVVESLEGEWAATLDATGDDAPMSALEDIQRGDGSQLAPMVAAALKADPADVEIVEEPASIPAYFPTDTQWTVKVTQHG